MAVLDRDLSPDLASMPAQWRFYTGTIRQPVEGGQWDECRQFMVVAPSYENALAQASVEMQHDAERGWYGETLSVQVMQGTYYLVARERNQAYGGPEEGGWWYDVTDVLAYVPVETVAQAQAVRDVLIATLREQYAEQREYTSAAGGSDLVIRLEDTVPASTPDRKPRYE